MRRVRNAGLVLCLFILYCVLLSQGLKANALSTLFGALAAVPLTVHLYNHVWPRAVRARPQTDRQTDGGGCDSTPSRPQGVSGPLSSKETQ